MPSRVRRHKPLMTETNCSHSPINQSIKGTDNARRPRSKRQHPGEAHHTHAAEGRVPRPDGDWVQPCLASTKAPLTPPKLHRIHEYACHPATYRQTPFHPETFLESQLHNVESSCYEERCGDARERALLPARESTNTWPVLLSRNRGMAPR